MDYHISHKTKTINAEVNLPTSKSISNRALIIQALTSGSFQIHKLSTSKDTQLLSTALKTKSNTIDVGDSGTAFRFLTALLACKEGEFTLTGSKRMKERPIKELVSALKKLGADIKYIEKEGYPPLQISGKQIEGGGISVDASISSQFVSALLLIAASLKKGLTISLEGDILSTPYIKMTLEILSYFGIESKWIGNTISVKNQPYKAKDITIEGDWSAVAFLLEIMSLAQSGTLKINGLFENSWQGDSKVLEIFKNLGVESKFQDSSLHLSKKEIVNSTSLDINLIDYPDLAQAYCCSLAGLGKTATIKGLQNLKYKESHRLSALKCELEKFQQKSNYTDTDFILRDSTLTSPKQNLETHNDHRMAMCLAPLGMLFDIKINDVEVVSKSYPTFWEDLKKMGFTVSALTR